MAEVRLIAQHTVLAGYEATVRAALDALVVKVRSEPGNLGFEVFWSKEQPRCCLLLEQFVSAAALETHRETPHFLDLVMRKIVPCLQSRTLECYEMSPAVTQAEP